MSENLLRHLISFEGGAVALLATALDRGGAEPAKGQKAFWSEFAKLCELPLSDSGPSSVHVEYEGTDLIMVWDKWTILLEAKVDNKYIRRGQVQQYYQKLRPLLGREESFKNASSMAVVLLIPSPSSIAQQEIDDLEIGQSGDQRRLLYWRQIIPLLRSSFSVDENEQQNERSKLLSSLLLQGVDQIGNLLEKGAAPGPMAVGSSPERQQCMRFVREVQKRVGETWTDERLHFNPIWSDKNSDEITANFVGPGSIGNLSLDVFPVSTISSDDTERSDFCGELYFKLAGRPSVALRAEFDRLKKQHLEAFFRIEGITIDQGKSRISYPMRWTGSRSELCDRVAGLFCTWLVKFRPFLSKHQSDLSHTA